MPWALLPAAWGNMACEEHTYGCCFSEDISNMRFVLLFSALPGVRKKPTGKSLLIKAGEDSKAKRKELTRVCC